MNKYGKFIRVLCSFGEDFPPMKWLIVLLAQCCSELPILIRCCRMYCGLQGNLYEQYYFNVYSVKSLEVIKKKHRKK